MVSSLHLPQKQKSRVELCSVEGKKKLFRIFPLKRSRSFCGATEVSEEPGPTIETCCVVLHTFNSVIVCHTECGEDFIHCFVLTRLLDSVEKASETVCLSLHCHSLPLRSIIPQPPHPDDLLNLFKLVCWPQVSPRMHVGTRNTCAARRVPMYP